MALFSNFLVDMTRRVGVPDDWVACQHPEGSLYFYHDQKVRIMHHLL